jgi:hypothetical protein
MRHLCIYIYPFNCSLLAEYYIRLISGYFVSSFLHFVREFKYISHDVFSKATSIYDLHIRTFILCPLLLTQVVSSSSCLGCFSLKQLPTKRDKSIRPFKWNISWLVLTPHVLKDRIQHNIRCKTKRNTNEWLYTVNLHFNALILMLISM